MTIAMPVTSASLDAAIDPLFDNAQYFVFVRDENESVVESMPYQGGRDIARALIAQNVDAVIVSELELDPFILLKSYGIQVYFVPYDHINMKEAIAKFRQNQLIEVTAKNFLELTDDHHHHACA